MIATAPVMFDNIPADLRALERFAPWRMEPRFPGEKPTKIPFNPRTLRRAQSNNPSTWGTFDNCRDVLDHRPGLFAGLGFMLGDDAPYCGFDLDDSVNTATSILCPRAQGIVNTLNTYTEFSQSWGGVKGILLAAMPTPDGAGKNYRRDPWGTGRGGIEMYRRARFFALTGRRVPGTPATVEPRELELANLYHELYPPTPPAPAPRRRFDATGDAADAVRRATAYIAKLPPSVSGAGGHDRLLHAACVLVRFGLNDADARALLDDYNARAVPPWADAELARKLREARKVAGHEAGTLLANRLGARRERTWGLKCPQVWKLGEGMKSAPFRMLNPRIINTPLRKRGAR